MQPSDETAIASYLHEVEESLADIPEEARREILSDLREHIAAGMTLRGGGSGHAMDVLNELGSPAAIGRAARAELGSEVRKPSLRSAREWIGCLSLPLIWPLGIALIWSSTVWTRREKVVATILFPGGIFLPLWISPLIYSGRTCYGHLSPEGVPVVDSCVPGDLELILRLGAEAILIAIPVVVASYLIVRLVQRA